MAPKRTARILRLPAVIERTGLGRDSIYKLARAGDFPKPIKLTTRASGWLESEVIDFIDRCASQREKDVQAPKA